MAVKPVYPGKLGNNTFTPPVNYTSQFTRPTVSTNTSMFHTHTPPIPLIIYYQHNTQYESFSRYNHPSLNFSHINIKHIQFRVTSMLINTNTRSPLTQTKLKFKLIRFLRLKKRTWNISRSNSSQPNKILSYITCFVVNAFVVRKLHLTVELWISWYLKINLTISLDKQWLHDIP